MYPRTFYSTLFSASYNYEDGLRCEAVWMYAGTGACGAVFRMTDYCRLSMIGCIEPIDVMLGGPS